jgi:hypothetical protein
VEGRDRNMLHNDESKVDNRYIESRGEKEGE